MASDDDWADELLELLQTEAEIVDAFPDATGDMVRVGVIKSRGVVVVGVDSSPAILDGEGRDRFMKAFAQAEIAAEREAGNPS